MGRVVDGQWVTDDVTATDASGRWTRSPTVVREWIRADGSTPFPPEAGRYHLWLAWNCTWSQRTLIVRNLLGLQEAIGVSMAHWHRNEGGWWFYEGLDDLHAETLQTWETWDPVDGFQPGDPRPGLNLWQVYVAGDPDYSGRATVPALWDRTHARVVNNESADILRMLQTELRALSNGVDLLPSDLIDAIDITNKDVYDRINNGVYKVGFARSQGAYEHALHELFTALDHYEVVLSRHRYLCGDRLTEADVRLFPTLIRFDPVYFGHFKCSMRRIADYPNLSGYLRDLYQTPGFAETVDVVKYKLGYMGRSERLNPSRIIPPGPVLDWDAPHGRDALGPRRIPGAPEA
jgi:glutathionyl-hydroquinone reductase